MEKVSFSGTDRTGASWKKNSCLDLTSVTEPLLVGMKLQFLLAQSAVIGLNAKPVYCLSRLHTTL